MLSSRSIKRGFEGFLVVFGGLKGVLVVPFWWVAVLLDTREVEVWDLIFVLLVEWDLFSSTTLATFETLVLWPEINIMRLTYTLFIQCLLNEKNCIAIT